MKEKTGYAHIKHRVYEVMQIGNREDLLSTSMDLLIVCNIVLNIICMFLATFEEMRPFMGLIEKLEICTILFFSVEYILRFWTAEYLFPEQSVMKARLHFLWSFDGIIDLLTILPFFFLSGFVVFRMLRVVRIFHLFRLNSQYDSFNVITSVIYEKKNQIISSLFIIIVLMFASSLCMYSIEHEAQPGVFQNAFSGIWWSMSTLLTVGYGDIYPITILGRCMAIVIAFLGVGVVAIPTGIISAGFVEQYARLKDAEDQTEPEKPSFFTMKIPADHIYCGKQIKDLKQLKSLNISVILRNHTAVIPREDTLIFPGDEIIYYAEEHHIS